MAKKRDQKIEIPVDDELKDWAEEYAKSTGFSVAAILRAIIRFWFNPNDPRPLPPGVQDEVKRPSRRKKDSSK